MQLIVTSGILIPPLASQIQAVGATHAPKIRGRSSQLFTHIFLGSQALKSIFRRKNNIIAMKYLTVKGITFAPCFISISKDLLPAGRNSKAKCPKMGCCD